MRHLRVVRDHVGGRAIGVPVREGRDRSLLDAGFEAASSLAEAAKSGASLAIIATDTSRHLSDAAEAIQCGLHVLIEKPLASDARGLRALEGEAARAARTIHVACNLRFHRGLARFRARAGEVGRAHAVRIECQSYLPSWRPDQDYTKSYSARADEGGVLRDLIHEIDYATWLFGRPSDVQCRMTSGASLGIAAEAAADLLWVAPGGAVVSVRLDYLTRTMRRRMTAFGDAGEIEWDAVAERVDVRLAGSAAAPESVPQPRDEMMQAQAEAFVRAAAGGDPGPLATFEEAAFAIALCDAARRSALSGRTESIADWRHAE
jgi:predicted dehydrogenase